MFLSRLLLRRMYFVVEHGQNGVKDVEDIAKRISTLCAGEKPAPWVAESSASAKLLFALYQIRRGDSSASKILAREAKEALAILRSSLLNEQNSSAISTSVDAIGKSAVEASGVRKAVPPGKKQPSAAARSKGPQVAMVPRKPLSPKSNVKQVSNRIVTPPRQNKRIEAENNFVGSQTDTMLYGLRERLQTSREALSLFDTTACVLSIFEHTFLRLAYLRLIKSVTQGNSAEPFVLVCLDLAYEYQQLGKYARAEAMLAQAQATANKADLSSEARVLLTLRKAEYLSHLGRTKER